MIYYYRVICVQFKDMQHVQKAVLEKDYLDNIVYSYDFIEFIFLSLNHFT